MSEPFVVRCPLCKKGLVRMTDAAWRAGCRSFTIRCNCNTLVEVQGPENYYPPDPWPPAVRVVV